MTTPKIKRIRPNSSESLNSTLAPIVLRFLETQREVQKNLMYDGVGMDEAAFLESRESVWTRPNLRWMAERAVGELLDKLDELGHLKR